MHANDLTWILVVLLITVPLLIVAIARLAWRKRGGIGSGLGGTLLVTLCWVTALLVILRRIDVF